MVPSEPTPNQEPNGTEPASGERDPWAHALSLTPAFRQARQAWELGAMLCDIIDAEGCGINPQREPPDLEQLKECVYAYLIDGCKNVRDLDARLERIPQLVQESRSYTHSFSTQYDSTLPADPLPQHLRTLIAQEAARCIMEELVSDALDSWEGTSKDSIFGFFEGVLEDLEALSRASEDDELAEQITKIIKKAAEEKENLDYLIDSAIASIEDGVADFINLTSKQLQTLRHLPSNDLDGISQYLTTDLKNRYITQCKDLSRQRHPSLDPSLDAALDAALEKLNSALTSPKTLPDCIRWFERAIDALSDEQSDLMREKETLRDDPASESEKAKQLPHLIQTFFTRSFNEPPSDQLNEEIQLAMRAYLLQASEEKAEEKLNAFSMKQRLQEVVRLIDTTRGVAVTSQREVLSIDHAVLQMATLYRELTTATVHSMVTVYLEDREADLVKRLDRIIQTFDCQPPILSNTSQEDPTAESQRKHERNKSLEPSTLAIEIETECKKVLAFFPVYFEEAVERTRLLMVACHLPVIEEALDGAARSLQENFRQSFEELITSTSKTHGPQ